MAGLWVVLLAGCALDPPTLPQPTATLDATPVAAATPRAWATATPIPTITPTIARASTATPTSIATPARSSPTPFEAVPPSSSPLARTDDGYCRRTFGAPSAARFSARLRDVQVRAANNSTDVVLQFDDVAGVLHGVAGCQWAGAWPQTNDLGAVVAPGPAFIALDLADWAHDEAFAASIVTDTLAMQQAPTPAVATLPPSDGGGAGGPTIAMSANSLDSRGVLLGIGLGEPRAFAIRVENDQVIVSIANEDAAPFPPVNDPLGEAQGTSAAEQTLFLVQDDALFRLNTSGAQPVSTTLTMVTGLAVNGTGTQLAVCANASDGSDHQALWLLNADGENERILADIGGCAEPVFSVDGDTVAFVAPAANGTTRSTVWTVPVTSGELTPVHPTWDQWTRSAPRWLSGDRLLYHAADENGARVLLINENGGEREVSARLLTGTAYRGVGAFVIDSEQDLIVVQALHAADDGDDLAILRADGSVVATEQRGFRQQPLGFTDDGLLYLTIECPSDTVQLYALRRRTADGVIETLLRGNTAHTIDVAVVQNDALLYVRAPADESTTQGSDIWLLANGGATRSRVHRSQTRITHIAPASAAP
jgi:hypothetical protein